MIADPDTPEEPIDTSTVHALAHELRTPLSAVVTLAELLQAATPAQLADAQHRQYVTDIRESALHGLAVVTAALDHAGPAKVFDPVVGQVRLTDVELVMLGRQVTTALQPLARSHGIRLSQCEHAGSIVVRTDARCVRQIVLNLVTNALRFTPEGGAVTVKTRLVEPAQAAISVIDTGVGIGGEEPAADPQSMPTHMKFGGQGIGLQIALALAAAIGAELTFESTTGQGTCATLLLPFKDEP